MIELATKLLISIGTFPSNTGPISSPFAIRSTSEHGDILSKKPDDFITDFLTIVLVQPVSIKILQGMFPMEPRIRKSGPTTILDFGNCLCFGFCAKCLN